MTYTVSNNYILYDGYKSELPMIFGKCVKCFRKDNTSFYLVKRNVIMDAYILSGIDERFPPEEMEKWYDENNG